MDEEISTFCAFTSATPEQAQQFLRLTDGNVEQAVELFFSNPDLGAAGNATAQRPQRSAGQTDPILIDEDEEANLDDDDDVQMTGSRAVGASLEDDEAMARRLQEEMYGGRGGGAGVNDDPESVRAPMARTTETLVGPGSDWRNDPESMNAAVFEQMARVRARGAGRSAPGIFNQREAPSIWAQDDPNNPEIHRQTLSRATGGASDQTSKANLLADLFRPPFDLIAQIPWADARDEGKDNEKWILVNVQDPSIFDCQVLNRDIWKNPSIRDTVKEHFIFLQYNKDDPRGTEYMQYYFANMRDSEDAYPHIAIIDPRTGEQVKTWSGSPAPKAADFLMELHEFLDRYSLKMEKKNPVQAKRKEKKKDVAQMSEEEMLEMALQNSLANGGGPKDEDPDALTRPHDGSVINGKGKAPVSAPIPEVMDIADMDPAPLSNSAPTHPSSSSTAPTPFSLISSTTPHTEPAASTAAAEVTRIQFRHAGGRVVRRFLLADSVRRLYEWLKAEPLPDTNGKNFELVSMGRNLMGDVLAERSIGDAGLKNGTVMVEVVDAEEDAA